MGASFFYLDNQSSRTLWVAFTGPHLNNQRDSTTAILPQQRVLIGQDADFGYMPKPADTFSSITLYTLVAGQKSAIYTQTPIQTGLWQKRKQNQTDPDFGCYQVDYTLAITDAVLK